jgi:hypothetical protein
MGLVVIFLPIFFERVSQDISLEKIPELPFQPSQNKLVSVTDFITLDTAQSINTSVANPPVAWIVQANQFIERVQADRLVEKLCHHGYPAYVQRITNKHNKYGVFIGPETDQVRLKNWLSTLKKQNVIGKIVIYSP